MFIGGNVYASNAIDTKTNIQPFSQEKWDINNIKTNNEQEKSQGTSFDEIKQDIYYDKLFGSEQPNTNNDFYAFYYKESQKDLKKNFRKLKLNLNIVNCFLVMIIIC